MFAVFSCLGGELSFTQGRRTRGRFSGLGLHASAFVAMNIAR